MTQICDRCGKRAQRGKQIARARQGLNYRSPKVFRVNLHSFSRVVNSRKEKLSLCTKCLRIVKKEQAEFKQKLMALKEAKEAPKKKNIEKPKKTVKKERVSRVEAREKRKKAKEEKEKGKEA